ncbi:GL14667 [Drosophila persimilis]|uniref:GL14667 n=1 Tax=Drosophila persimilis TaxID=7234 RepID=B4GVJ5_DROPE|nr:GL14667 [Drosophila persimilis]
MAVVAHAKGHSIARQEPNPGGHTAPEPAGNSRYQPARRLKWTALIERILARMNRKTRRVKPLVNDDGHIGVRGHARGVPGHRRGDLLK